jgi:hypothetical protein
MVLAIPPSCPTGTTILDVRSVHERGEYAIVIHVDECTFLRLGW